MIPLLPRTKPNMVDRLVGFFSPHRAVRRYGARQVLSLAEGGYEGAGSRTSALFTFNPLATSADAAALPNIETLRARSRALTRNAPLARGAINTNVTNVVGTGLKVQPQIDREVLGLTDDAADAWERAAAREFALWGETQECDLTRVQTFAGLQDLAFRSTLDSGDVFAVNRFVARRGSLYDFKIQMVEADRVSTPGRLAFQIVQGTPPIIGGVEIDDNGAPAAYWISDRHPGDFTSGALKWTRVPAYDTSGERQVLHLYDRQRPDAHRGVPYLAPVIASLKQLTRYSDAEIMAAVVNSCFAIVTKTEDGGGLALAQTQTTDAKDDTIALTEPGAIVDLDPNETIENFAPGRPNPSFDPFFDAMAQQIGVALEIPKELLLKHFQASYSASRATLILAWQFFRVRRKWLADNFCQPSYGTVIAEAVMRGRLSARGFFDDPLVRKAWLGAVWIGPAPGQIDPVKETKAAVERIDNGISTLSEEVAAITGGDWETKHKQRVKENNARKRDGLEAAAAAPAPAALAPPDGEDPDDDGAADRPDDETETET